MGGHPAKFHRCTTEPSFLDERIQAALSQPLQRAITGGKNHRALVDLALRKLDDAALCSTFPL